mmetsp:Transcript_135909/g.330378  ORF Transcript_135909/g.330378 Transcript_135909/m.330378 type:complete len:201 (-) Transcript_135909:744-1346(-)
MMGWLAKRGSSARSARVLQVEARGKDRVIENAAGPAHPRSVRVAITSNAIVCCVVPAAMLLIIRLHLNTDVATLPPVGAPRVLDIIPAHIASLWHLVAHQCHSMIHSEVTLVIAEDTLTVHEPFRGVDGYSNGAASSHQGLQQWLLLVCGQDLKAGDADLVVGEDVLLAWRICTHVTPLNGKRQTALLLQHAVCKLHCGP